MLGWDDILELAGRGSWGLKEPDQYRPDGGYHVVAARVTGQFPSSIKSAESAEEKTRPGTANVIVIADAEFVTDAFFDHHRQSTDFLRIDNTIFILNCVDQLIGDTRFIDVRKRRSRQRTLEQIEKRKREFEEVQQKEEEKADEESRKKLDAARQRIDDAVRKVNERGDIDIQEKLQLVAITQEAEERKFEVAEKQIKLEQEAAKKRAKENYEQALRGTQKAYTVLAIVLPPIPALLLGFVMFIGRMRREYATVSEKRLL